MNQKISKSVQLEKLFKDWEKAQEAEPEEIWMRTNGGNSNISRSHFRRDGIIDESTFLAEKRKVLFVSNEANDNEYSAKNNAKPGNIDDYRKYYESRYDDWKGKMRERTSALYKVIAGYGIDEISDSDAAIHYAVMDINKLGGGSDIKGGNHIEEYCKYYRDFIRREIEIIDPDVVVWLGTKTYDMDLCGKYLGAKRCGSRRYLFLEEKKAPVLRMWYTSYYQGRIETLPGYDNRITGKLCAKCVEEMKRYGL